MVSPSQKLYAISRADIRVRIRNRIIRVHVSEAVVRPVVRITADRDANLSTATTNFILF